MIKKRQHLDCKIWAKFQESFKVNELLNIYLNFSPIQFKLDKKVKNIQKYFKLCFHLFQFNFQNVFHYLKFLLKYFILKIIETPNRVTKIKWIFYRNEIWKNFEFFSRRYVEHQIFTCLWKCVMTFSYALSPKCVIILFWSSTSAPAIKS